MGRKPKVEGPDLKSVRCELARRSFWHYCKIKHPEHYKDDRRYLRRICDEMQAFLESPDEMVLIVNAPPRHYKSLTATSLCEWWIGKNPAAKVMTGSYNETLSQTFSKAVRGTIETQEGDPSKIVFSDIFRGVRIKRGDGAAERWSLEGQHATYLATSPTGTATGFGATLMVIDDIIKSALEANNAAILEARWTWFKDTMMSRLEEGGKVIIVMTRWATRDLAGRAKSHFEAIGRPVRMLTFKTPQDDGTMLCDEVLSMKSYEDRRRTLSPEILAANYRQEPIDIRGRLYAELKTYGVLPEMATGPFSYCDTADEGADYLCQIIYRVLDGEVYVVDVYYTRDSMEVTEPEAANRLTAHGVEEAVFESNNGGRGFARSVGRILSDVLRNWRTVVRWKAQTSNKASRIITMSAWITQHVYFPANWRDRWPDFYESMTTYQRDGKNDHDDAEDCVTAIAERVSRPAGGVVDVAL
jgi:predicted phage terminase large subunit-like protein